MHSFSSRTTALIAAAVALVLIGMQLRSEGASGYDLGDVLSIVVAVLPVLFHGARVRGPRRSSGDGADGEAAATDVGRRGLDDVSASDGARPVDHAPPDADEDDGLVRQLLSNGAAWLLAGLSWTLTVVLVVLQAWPAALSALIVFVVAAATINPSRKRMPELVSDRGGGGRAPR